MNDKEKLEESIRQIDDLLENISEIKEKWLDELQPNQPTPQHNQFDILLGKAKFLGAVITDLENMKKTLES